MMADLNETIEQAHQDVEATEQQARQLEARLRRIAGMERLLPARQYGKPFPIDWLKGNITARSLVNTWDPALASYLGVQSGSARLAEERKVAREMQAEALAMRTERLRQQNADAQLQRERASIAGINPHTGRRQGT